MKAAALFFLGLAVGAAQPNALRPHPSLAPEQVVRAVVEGIRHNSSPIPNSGIYTTYQFASPANHAVTGPYGHFLRVVKTPDFKAMFRLDPYELGPIEITADHAVQDLRIRTEAGRTVNYRFSLSRQKNGPYRDCWMVDGVVRLL